MAQELRRARQAERPVGREAQIYNAEWGSTSSQPKLPELDHCSFYRMERAYIIIIVIVVVAITLIIIKVTQ